MFANHRDKDAELHEVLEHGIEMADMALMMGMPKTVAETDVAINMAIDAIGVVMKTFKLSGKDLTDKQLLDGLEVISNFTEMSQMLHAYKQQLKEIES